MGIPKIKVCGVTRLVDLDALADAGVDTVGFNFVPRSPRSITPISARLLCARAAELELIRVAVVMDLEPQELQQLLSQIEVDFIQLHGCESPQLAAACGGIPIIKATSWSGREDEATLVAAWQAATASRSNTPIAKTSQLTAWLVDAYAPDLGGGTGRVACWDQLNPRPPSLDTRPLILAGGLNPQNVATAIDATAADGVDTASGVESSPGIKDADLVKQFASNARAAFAEAKG